MSNTAGQSPSPDETSFSAGGDGDLGDAGSGNPDTDRAYLQDQAPAQVDGEAPEQASDAGDEPGSNADAARS